MGSRGGPTIVRIHGGNGLGTSGGIECCFCRCCTCINVNFLKSTAGLIKIAEVVIASFCQSMLINYGLRQADLIGVSFHSFLTTASACLMTTAILLGCYTFTSKSFALIRQSPFEMVFNAWAAFLYISASSYLAFSVRTFLYPVYVEIPFSQVYAAMTALTSTYILGGIVGLVHAYDAYVAYRYYRGFR